MHPNRVTANNIVLAVFSIVLFLFCTGCNALEKITGVPVKPRPMCRGIESTNAADSTGTRALGSVYPAVPCDNITYRDTIR